MLYARFVEQSNGGKTMNVVISSSTLGSGLVYEEGMLHDWRVKRRLGSDNMLDAGFVRDYKAASLLDALLNMDVPLMRARVSLGAAVMQRTSIPLT